MGSFSARGPGPIGDILKPDVTAPGINILAGAAPDERVAGGIDDVDDQRALLVFADLGGGHHRSTATARSAS